jgi:23S rRNA (cytosine1962-C5)-methyltransferase
VTGPRVVLARKGVGHLNHGHPWIRAPHLQDIEAEDGDVVTLEAPAGTVRGVAVYGASSRLPVRVVSRDPAFDGAGDGWWRARLDAAIARRAQVVDEACRWVHAEADGLPGLVVDRYGPVAVVQAGCRWADEVVPAVAEHLVSAHGLAGVLARHDGGFRKPEGLDQGVTVLAGEVPERVDVTLAGLVRSVDVWHGQKTGAFLDQRENHAWAAEVLPVGRALDAFAHEGGFALSLARAGSRVLAVDGSESALARLTANAERNDLGEAIETRRANVFDVLRQLEPGSLDAAVVDPPALAKRRADVDRAVRAYRDLNLRAMRLLRPGGRLVTCSCSHHLPPEVFRRVLGQAAASAGRDVVLLEERGAAPCHPRLITFPESGYLKLALVEVRA